MSAVLGFFASFWPGLVMAALLFVTWLFAPSPEAASNDTRDLPTAEPKHRYHDYPEPRWTTGLPERTSGLPKRIPGAALNDSVAAEIAGWVA